MDWTVITERFTQTYGIPGLVIIGMGIALNKLWAAYKDEVAARAADNKAVALSAITAIERNTQVLTSLTEVVKERRR